MGVFGVGYLFNRVVESSNISFHFDYLFDETEQKIGTEISGIRVESLSQLKTKTDIGCILIFSEMFFQEMSAKIKFSFKGPKLEIIDVHYMAVK